MSEPFEPTNKSTDNLTDNAPESASTPDEAAAASATPSSEKSPLSQQAAILPRSPSAASKKTLSPEEESQSQQPAGAHLRHFNRGESTEDIPIKKSNLGGIEDSLGKAKQVFSEKMSDVKSKTNKTKNNKTVAWIKKHFILALMFAIIVPIGVFIAINIPSQIARSKAFSLYQNGDYNEALSQFRSYLKSNPNDTVAALQAAHTALAVGEYSYAVRVLENVADIGNIAQTNEYRFTYALSITPNPRSIDVLAKLISTAPDHSGGRLLRGILLLQEEDKTALGRDDFLKVQNIIRENKNFDNTNLLAVHKRIVNTSPPLLPIFGLSPQNDNIAIQNIAYRLNIPPVYSDFYINSYFSILPQDPGENGIGDDAIVSMYYTLLLLKARELEEARVELSKLPADLLSDSLVGSLSGIYHSIRGEYSRAVEIFQAIATKHPNNPQILFNLANASYFADPSAAGVNAALALMSKVIELDNTMIEAYHNRAFLNLLVGDQNNAQKDIQTIAQNFNTLKTKHLQALIVLFQDPTSKQINILLKNDPDKAAAVPYIQAAHNFAIKNYDQALQWLAPKNNNHNFARRLYAEQLADVGLILRARNVLIPIARGDIAVNYEIARLELAVGNIDATQKIATQIALISETDPHGIALGAFILHQQEKIDEALVAIKEAIDATDSIFIRRQIAVDATDLFIDGDDTAFLVELLSSLPTLSPIETAVLFHLGDSSNSELEEMAKSALIRHPVFDVQFHVGMGMLKAGQIDNALQILQDASNWQPTNIPLLVALQTLYADKGNNLSVARLQEIIDNIQNYTANLDNPLNQESYLIIPAESLELQKEVISALQKRTSPKLAKNKFSELISEEKNPLKRGILHLQRGSFLLLLKQYDNAIEDLEAASQTQQMSEENKFIALAYLGKAFSLTKNYRLAGKTYQDASILMPELPIYRRLAGEALRRSNNLDIAAKYMEESVALYPANIKYYIILAQIYSQQGKQAESIDILRKAVRAAPLYTPTYSVLSKAQSISNNTDAAKENSTIVSNLTSRS